MRIGFAMTYAGGISGGRLHAFLLAAELAAQGHDVVLVCNQPPSFVDKLPPVPGRDAVKFAKLKFNLLRPPTSLVFDLWVVVHERSLNGRFFAPVFENARRLRTPLLLLTFETPNWQAAVLPVFKNASYDALLGEVARLGAQCLSSTQVGRDWARRQFPELSGANFHVLSPPVTAGWYAGEVPRDERLILAFTRRSAPHKGYDTILRVLNPRLRGRRIVLVDGFGSSYESRHFIEHKRTHEGLDLELRANIDDEEKYRLIKAARVLLYPSSFEGFGLPPGEARYWGTPVICYDLPVLREVYGNSMRYVKDGDAAAFEEALHRELAMEPDYTPAPEARRIGDFGRWRDDVGAMLAAVLAQARPPLELPAAVLPAAVTPVIAAQLGDWTKEDAAAALGRTIGDCAVLSFDREVYAQGKMDREQRLLPPGDTLLPPGNASDNLRGRLIAVLERLTGPDVLLTEDLIVCPTEVAGAAAEELARSGAEAVAIPVCWHFQADGLRHYRTETGEMLAACGLFRREFLLACLRRTTRPGCRSQPVIDASFLVLAHGGRIVAATERAERLPPRSAPMEFEFLPGGGGTWHEEYGERRTSLLPVAPLPCRRADDAEELAFQVQFRNQMAGVLADAVDRRIHRSLVSGMSAALARYSPLWRAAIDPADPVRTMLRVDGEFARLGRCFLTRRHLTVFTQFVLVAQGAVARLGPRIPPELGGYARELRAVADEFSLLE